jgi:hypothetical protein
MMDKPEGGIQNFFSHQTCWMAGGGVFALYQIRIHTCLNGVLSPQIVAHAKHFLGEST